MPYDGYSLRPKRNHRQRVAGGRAGSGSTLSDLSLCLESRPIVVKASGLCWIDLLDAALDEPAPPRPPRTKGRPRLKGDRLPTLRQVSDDSTTRWRHLRVPQWDGQGQRWVEIASATAVWYHVGEPIVPIRWILVRDRLGRFESRALGCTAPRWTLNKALAWFIRRWCVETQRQWNDQAIQRTTPVLRGLFSIVAFGGASANPQRNLYHSTSRLVSKEPSDILRRITEKST